MRGKEQGRKETNGGEESEGKQRRGRGRVILVEGKGRGDIRGERD